MNIQPPNERSSDGPAAPCTQFTHPVHKFNCSALNFKDISLKATFSVRGGVSINSIYYTIFLKLLCPALCWNLLLL